MDPMGKPVGFREPSQTRGERGRRNLPWTFWSSGTGSRIRSDYFLLTDLFAVFLISCLALSRVVACTLAFRTEFRGDLGVAELVLFSQLGVGVALKLESEWFRGINSQSREFNLLLRLLGV